MPPAFWLGARDVVAGRDLPSLPVVFSNLGISEVASSFRRTLATVLSSAMVCLAVAQTIKDVTDHPWAGDEVVMTLTARDEGGNEGRSEPFAFHLPERAFTKPLAKALVEQRRNLALDARVRSQVITAVDALTLGPDKFRTEAGIYLGLRSIFWSLVRAKSDDDLREVAARLWLMAVGLEDGDISEAQAALRAAQEALRNALDRGVERARAAAQTFKAGWPSPRVAGRDP